LNPKINIWNTGSSNGTGNSFDTIRELSKCIPPMIETIYDQTNIELPEWLLKVKKEKEA
jgi:flotillin